MINIKDIKTIDVLHTSFDSDGELVDNFAIVDTLLERIEQLEAAIKHLNDDPHVFSPRPCATCRRFSKLIGVPFGCDQLRSLASSSPTGE